MRLFKFGHTSISSEPVNLPPDGKLKRIRFSQTKKLRYLPKGEVVELSLEEVKQVYPDIEKGEALVCPSCYSTKDSLFWFQYGLKPKLEESTGIHLKCQRCGHSDYL
jgi:hypothetical protein